MKPHFPETATMPYSLLIVFFATGLTLLAAGSPLGVIFLVLSAIVTSLNRHARRKGSSATVCRSGRQGKAALPD